MSLLVSVLVSGTIVIRVLEAVKAILQEKECVLVIIGMTVVRGTINWNWYSHFNESIVPLTWTENGNGDFLAVKHVLQNKFPEFPTHFNLFS